MPSDKIHPSAKSRVWPSVPATRFWKTLFWVPERTPPFQPLPRAALMLGLALLAVFGWQLIIGIPYSIQAFGAIPVNVTSWQRLFTINDSQAVPAWITLITYAFLHGGWLHLLTNLFSLWVTGALLESWIGVRKFLLGYVSFGVIGALFVAFLFPGDSTPAYGASLAFLGLLGAYCAVLLRLNVPAGKLRLVVILETLVGVSIPLSILFARPEPGGGGILYHLVPFVCGWLWARVSPSLGREYA